MDPFSLSLNRGFDSMIIDTFRNSDSYPLGPAWEKTLAFLRSLPPDIEAGRYEIEGEDIFAIVMNYETRSPAEGILEAHRRYVDVQSVLAGGEACEWHPAEGLSATQVYDEGRDAEFYVRPSSAPARFLLSPGFFAVFFPGDGHMTSLTAGEKPEAVKKVVVKIRAELLA